MSAYVDSFAFFSLEIIDAFNDMHNWAFLSLACNPALTRTEHQSESIYTYFPFMRLLTAHALFTFSSFENHIRTHWFELGKDADARSQPY